MDEDFDTIKVVLHLSSGSTITTLIDVDPDLDQDEVNTHIQRLLANQEAIRYRLKIGDVVFHRDAVIAIQHIETI